MQRTGWARVFPYVAALVIIVPCVAALHSTPAITAVAAAPVLLLAVLIIARTWGTGPGLVVHQRNSRRPQVAAAVPEAVSLDGASLFLQDRLKV